LKSISFLLHSIDSWHKNLLDRIRTDIVKVRPAFVTEIIVRSSDTDKSMKIGIFSTGDKNYYSNLIKAVEEIEQQTHLKLEIQKVQDGVLNYFPDFEAPISVSNDDFDKSFANDQWKSQTPLGIQTILQFETLPYLTSISVGESVLFQFKKHIFDGAWQPVKVTHHNSDGTYNIIDDYGITRQKILRHALRKFETEEELNLDLSVGDKILIDDVGEDFWYQGSILKVLGGDTYEVAYYIEGSNKIFHRKHLMRMIEIFQHIRASPLSIPIVKEALESMRLFNETIKTYTYNEYAFITTGFWSQGRAILSCNGKNHIHLNLFTTEDKNEISDFFKNSLLKKIPHLSFQIRDEQPRGFGRVVNFQKDLLNSPYWVDETLSKN